FDYSLTDLPVGENQLEKFLFVKKKGNCEYFATAMAIILRINNIPSRVVGGYKTSTYNDIGKYYLVKEKDAHLWVEAYINGRWIRFDPTPPIRNQILQTIERPSKIKLFYDTINYYYNIFILNYDFSKQMTLYKTVSSKVSLLKNIDIDKKRLIIYILYLIFVFISVLLVVMLYRYSRESYEKKLVRLLIKKLKKLGINKAENEGLEEFIMKIDNENLRNKVLKLVKDIEKYMYGKRKMDKETFKHLKRELNGII
ncbi:MAG: transglutaminase-like domain-containing protein, partial [Hydrogenothermaceae bacterium]